MKRIDTTHAVADANGAGKNGFGNGNPGLTAATEVDESWLNHVQEEIANVIENAGLTLSSASKSQLLDAIKPAIASYEISGAGRANGVKMTLTADFADSVYTLATNRVTVGQAGVYRVRVDMAHTCNDASADKESGVYLLRNGTADYYAKSVRAAADANVHIFAHAEWFLSLAASDYLEVFSGAGGVSEITALGGTLYSKLLIERLRRT